MSDPKTRQTRDGFEAVRPSGSMLADQPDGEKITLILRHRDVRAAAKDWETFSSDALCRVPIPSEERVRTVRQIPIELDPPAHTAYRKLIEPWFLRPTKPEYITKLDELVAAMLESLRGGGKVEIVSEFALPLQSRALAILLNLPEQEAQRWIAWGGSVYREGDGAAKGRQLDSYCREQLRRARSDNSAEDFFAFLARQKLGERFLKEEELLGIANLTFAGGRDTVINAIAETIAFFADRPEDAKRVIKNPKLAINAVEELVRWASPLSLIGRVCPNGARVDENSVGPDRRIGLCWASANHDPTVFDEPHHYRLDRMPNPHLAFGSGKHSCLGAAHARSLLRVLVNRLAPMADALDVVEKEPAFEWIGNTRRRLGFSRLCVKSAA